ncbi:hypothetical protein F4778DRAFT_763884 [Xylariomycetidae sp. FL2044]|nr:hypothetical protein F4778DRAFT_763884 [Xylariomycetidae sp. FL2044]
MAVASDQSSIAELSREVRRDLSALVSAAKHQESADILSSEYTALEDISDRFELWTASLGALHDPKSRLSLETRLSDSPEILHQIRENLQDLREALQDYIFLGVDGHSSDSSSKAELEDVIDSEDVMMPEEPSRGEQANMVLDMVNQCVKALFRIDMLVRKATPQERFQRAVQQSRFPFPAQFDINYVKEKYPKLVSDQGEKIVIQLGNANAKRRQFIKYGHDHKAKFDIEDPGSKDEEPEPVIKDQTVIGNLTEKVSSKATTFLLPREHSDPQWLQPTAAKDEDEDETASLTTATTGFESERSLKLPRLQQLSPDGQAFECPICFTQQSFRGEKAWKIHAFSDLKAYVCTAGDAKCSNKLFSNRDTWFEHELQHHRCSFVCKICSYESPLRDNLRSHVISNHGSLPHDHLSTLLEGRTIVPTRLRASDCPFCDDWARTLQERQDGKGPAVEPGDDSMGVTVPLLRFKRHVATHHEQLAIFALPISCNSMDEYDDEGIGSNDSMINFDQDISAGKGVPFPGNLFDKSIGRENSTGIMEGDDTTSNITAPIIEPTVSQDEITWDYARESLDDDVVNPGEDTETTGAINDLDYDFSEVDKKLQGTANEEEAEIETVAVAIAQALRGAGPPDTWVLIKNLPMLSHDEIMSLREEYRTLVKAGIERKGGDVAKHIRARLQNYNHDLMILCYATALGRWESECAWLQGFDSGDGALHPDRLIQVLMGRTNTEIRMIKSAFKDALYGNNLKDFLEAKVPAVIASIPGAEEFREALRMVMDKKRMEELDEDGQPLPIDEALAKADARILQAVKEDPFGTGTATLVLRSDSHLRVTLRIYESDNGDLFSQHNRSPGLMHQTMEHIIRGIKERPERNAMKVLNSFESPRDLGLLLTRIHWDRTAMAELVETYTRTTSRSLSEQIAFCPMDADVRHFCHRLVASKRKRPSV